MGKKERSPNFSEERRLWRKGYRIIIGVDEAGRGAFAGPLTVAAVCFGCYESEANSRGRLPLQQIGDLELYLKKIGVNDSKVLRPRTREKLAKEIKKLALAYSVASVSVGMINRIGVGRATERAMRSVITKLKTQNSGLKTTAQNLKLNGEVFVLSDMFHIKYLKGVGLKNQKAIKRGDKKSLSIAAASILAKVHRDRIMRKLSHRFPQYAWAKNKGYGTKKHCLAILRYGLTRLHRKAFVRNFLGKQVA